MWSSGAIFVKLGLEYSSVWSFLALRSFFSFLILSAIIFIFFRDKYKNIFNLDKKNLLGILLVGLLLQVLYQIFYFLAIFNHLSPGLLSIFLGLQPLLTALLLQQINSLYKWFILFSGFFGLIMAVSGARDVSNITTAGVLFSILAMASISIGSIFQNKNNNDLLVSALLHSLLSSVIFISILPFVDHHVIWNLKFTFSVLWMTIIVSISAMLLLFHLLRNNSADKVSVLFFLVPIVTIFFDYLVFDTKISWITGISTLIVIISIYFFNKQKSYSK